MDMLILGTSGQSVYAYLNNIAASVNKIHWYFYTSEIDYLGPITSTTIINQNSTRIEKINNIPEGHYTEVRVYVYYDEILDNEQNWESYDYGIGFSIIPGREMAASFSSGKIEITFSGFDPNYQESRQVHLYLNYSSDSNGALNDDNPIKLEGGQDKYTFTVNADNKQRTGNNVIIATIDVNTETVYLATHFYVQPSSGGKEPQIDVNNISYNKTTNRIEYNFTISNINSANYAIELFINDQSFAERSYRSTNYDEGPYKDTIYFYGDKEINNLNAGTYQWKITATSYRSGGDAISYSSQKSGYIKIILIGTLDVSWISNKKIYLEQNKQVIYSYYPEISASNFKSFCDDVQKKFKIDEEEMDEFKEKIYSGGQMKKEFFEFLLDCMGAEDEKEKLKNQSVMYDINNNFDCFLLLENAYKKYS